MLDYKFDKDSVYLAACTYGSPSMALVDMLQKEGVKPVIIYIDYKIFDEEEHVVNNLKKYCEEHDLVFEYCDTNSCDTLGKESDYRGWARNVRYSFFKKIYEKYDASALFLAHTQDDLIETILDSKQNGHSSAKYSLSAVSTKFGMVVVRPLLKFTPEDLEEYDIENSVPFSKVVTDEEIAHLKSSVHYEVIKKLSEVDRENLIEEMKQTRHDSLELIEDVREEILAGEELDVRTLIALSKDDFSATILHFILRTDPKVKLSAAKIEQIRKFLLSDKVNDAFKLAGDTYLIKEYDLVTVGSNFEHLPYTYVLESEGELHTDEFDLDFSMGAEDRGIKKEDYPITIRTALPSDLYSPHGYLEPVRTLFSTWGMPVSLRYMWPVFVNKNGKIIYVPRFRKSFSEYHTSVLKLHINVGE
ncbi:MAG: ATP-binding protein [Bacilli bacterium]|nr:ATP-binding protein [Bacilli bacterium]MDY6430418.1 ATP-binding protein [Bacilli bacterium]